MRHVLVTGGAGYIGSVLTEMLLDDGCQVTVLDRMFFGNTLAHLAKRNTLRIVKGDIRTFDPALLDDVGIVCDLAALSNDPAGELDPTKTVEINCRGRARVARLAKQRGVARYILASSCSVYGFQDGVMTERSSPRPLTTYAQANLDAEAATLPLGGERFCVTALRQATVYGMSPRMRFDLAINGMTLGIFERGKLPVLRDGTQWRPMVHVKDTCRAFLAVLGADPELVNRQIFNVGSNPQNWQILPLAKVIAESVGKTLDYEWYGEPDHRSYRVSFDKIHAALGYDAEYGPADAAREIFAGLESGRLAPIAQTRTVEWYKSLIHWHGVLREVVVDDAVL